MCQKWEGNCGLWVLNEMIFKKYGERLKKIVGAVNLGGNGLDWLCCLAGNSQMAPIIFFKLSQTTIALPFLTHNISAIGGVSMFSIYIIFFFSELMLKRPAHRFHYV